MQPEERPGEGYIKDRIVFIAAAPVYKKFNKEVYMETFRFNKKVLAVVVLLSVLIIDVSANGKDEGSSGPTYTEYETLLPLIEAKSPNYILVDVRTEEEYAAGHIPTAVNIPVQVIETHLPAENRDELIIVYCRSGNRSGRARSLLSEMGFTNIQDFGAVSKWEKDLIKGAEPGEL